MILLDKKMRIFLEGKRKFPFEEVFSFEEGIGLKNHFSLVTEKDFCSIPFHSLTLRSGLFVL